MTKMIVGLGNPGEEYEHTRHNAGFDSLDLVAEEVGARYWKTECGALTAKGVVVDSLESVVPSLDDVFLDVVDRS